MKCFTLSQIKLDHAVAILQVGSVASI